MEEFKQRLLELEHHSERFEQYYLNYLSNEAIETLIRIRMLLENDELTEYACILGVIRNIEYFETAIKQRAEPKNRFRPLLNQSLNSNSLYSGTPTACAILKMTSSEGALVAVSILLICV